MLKSSIAEELNTILAEGGVSEGKSIMVHSDLRQAGFERDASGHYQLVLGPEILFRLLLQLISQTGTMIVPTFSNSWSSGLPYDPATSQSRLGSFSEFFRRQPGVIRSSNPMMSVAALGPLKHDFVEDVDESCFGPGSTYGRIYEANVLQVMIGTSRNSLNDYVQTNCIVPYRYPKFFVNPIPENDLNTPFCLHYVRYPGIGEDLKTAIEGLDPDLKESVPHFKAGNLGIFVVPTVTLAEVIRTQLRRDPYTFQTFVRNKEEIEIISRMHRSLSGVDQFAVDLDGREVWCYLIVNSSSVNAGYLMARVDIEGPESDSFKIIQLASNLSSVPVEKRSKKLWKKIQETLSPVAAFDSCPQLTEAAQIVYAKRTVPNR